MTEEMIDVVDENDEVIDVKPKSEVWDKVLLHRGIIIFLVNSKNEIFVHQRALVKKTYPGWWDIFINGYTSSKEDYDEAAKRELKEETGIDAEKLNLIKKIRCKLPHDDWFGKLYKVVYDGELTLQKEELEQGKFIPFEQLDEFVKTHKIKPSSLFIYENFRGLIK